MANRGKGITFIVLVVLEVVLSLALGYGEPFGHTESVRLAHEYLAHPTPQNKAAMEAEWELAYAPERKETE